LPFLLAHIDRQPFNLLNGNVGLLQNRKGIEIEIGGHGGDLREWSGLGFGRRREKLRSYRAKN